MPHELELNLDVVAYENSSQEDDECEWASSIVRCAYCQYVWLAVVPVESTLYNTETGVLDGLECPECEHPRGRST